MPCITNLRLSPLYLQLTGERGALDWETRLQIIRDIAQGVNHLSTCDVIHRDLKPANMLLDDEWNAKVADFGTARLYVARSTAARPPTIIGTL
jgi:serine/threonine protein kinase